MARSMARWTTWIVFAISRLSLAQPRKLFHGGTIATWNDTTETVEVYRDASLLLEGDEILRIYKSNDSVDKTNAEIIDASNKIIVPGFISTHHHVWQTLYRTLIPDLPFATYFPRMSHLAPISSTLSVEDIYRSQLMGALELLSEGTTTWVDITAVLSPETVEAAWKATFASGGRSFFGATVADREDFPEDAQIAQIRNLSGRPELHDQPLVTLGLSYDGFDGSTSSSRTKILDLIHSGDVDFITTHYVGGPLGSYNSPQLLNQADWSILNSTLPIIFSHASQITPQDAYLLRETNQYISTAPESEQHAGIGHPYSHLIQDQASLAADSTFAFSTSLVHQARMWLQQVRGTLSQLVVDQWGLNTNTPMTVNQAFYLATRAGALALRRNDLGIIAEGAKADLVLYETTKPDLLGWRDPVAAIFLHSNPGDISDVVVGGKFVKRGFNLTFKGLDKLREDFLESASAFTKKYNNYDFGPLPHWFYLATYEKAMEVDVVRGDATGY